MSNSSYQTPKRLRFVGRSGIVLGLLGFLFAGVVSVMLWGKFRRPDNGIPTPNGQKYLGAHSQKALTVAFSPGGRLLASGSVDGIVKIWDSTTGEERAALAGHIGPVETVGFSLDGNTLASGGGYRDGTVRLWDVRTGQQRAEFSVTHPDYIYVLASSVAFSEDGKTLAAGLATRTDDRQLGGEVILWDAGTGKQLHKLEGIFSSPRTSKE